MSQVVSLSKQLTDEDDHDDVDDDEGDNVDDDHVLNAAVAADDEDDKDRNE